MKIYTKQKRKKIYAIGRQQPERSANFIKDNVNWRN